MRLLATDLTAARGPACIVGGPEDCEQVCDGRNHCQYMEGFLTGGSCETFDPGILDTLGSGFPLDRGPSEPGELRIGPGMGDEGVRGASGGAVDLGRLDWSPPREDGEDDEDDED